jgi:hypothetical protein
MNVTKTNVCSSSSHGALTWQINWSAVAGMVQRMPIQAGDSVRMLNSWFLMYMKHSPTILQHPPDPLAELSMGSYQECSSGIIGSSQMALYRAKRVSTHSTGAHVTLSAPVETAAAIWSDTQHEDPRLIKKQ